MDILTTADVCKLLKTKRISLYGLVKSGEIPAFRIGRAWRFELASVEEWIKKKTEKERSK